MNEHANSTSGFGDKDARDDAKGKGVAAKPNGLVEHALSEADARFVARAVIGLNESVTGLDAATRAKLAAARRGALLGTAPKGAGKSFMLPRQWAPGGALAFAVLLAVAVGWQWNAGQARQSADTMPLAALNDEVNGLEWLLRSDSGEALEFEHEPEFYAWVDDVLASEASARGG